MTTPYSKGIVLTFGSNEDGQCGVKRTNQVSVPFPLLIQFPDRISIKAISAGSRHSLALSSNGQVFSWGWGMLGQLGN